jgi:hypothetical protein
MGAEPPRRAPRSVGSEPVVDRDVQVPGTKKKYYN